MGRTYAGVLGPLAFVTVVARGLVHAGPVEATIQQATVCLFLFALIGCLIGNTAEWIVNDSVRGRLADEMAAGPTQSKSRP